MIPAERSHLRVAATSHPGMSGKNNEDRYSVSAYRLSDENPLPIVLAIVSDGIGGHQAGEIAAQIAVETISQAVAASDATAPTETLKQAISQASELIRGQAESKSERQGMGATCACAWIIENRLYTASVGDSRIYLLRKGGISQISIDHTWIQDAIDAGIMTREDAKGHPNAHVIRRYLGSKQPVETDIRMRLQVGEDDAQAEANQGFLLQPGDQIFLCSDGLTDLVSDAEILSTMNAHDQEKAIETLVDMANQRGGHDNITLVALGIPSISHRGQAAPSTRRQANLSFGCLLIALITLLAAIIIGSIFLYQRINTPPTLTPTITTQLLIAEATDTAPVIITPPTDMPTETVPPVEATIEPTLTLTPWPTNTLQGTPAGN